MATSRVLTRPVVHMIVYWLVVSLHLDIEDLSAFHSAFAGVDPQAVGLHIDQPGSPAKKIFHVNDAAELPTSGNVRTGDVRVQWVGGQRVSDSG